MAGPRTSHATAAACAGDQPASVVCGRRCSLSGWRDVLVVAVRRLGQEDLPLMRAAQHLFDELIQEAAARCFLGFARPSPAPGVRRLAPRWLRVRRRADPSGQRCRDVPVRAWSGAGIPTPRHRQATRYRVGRACRGARLLRHVGRRLTPTTLRPRRPTAPLVPSRRHTRWCSPGASVRQSPSRRSAAPRCCRAYYSFRRHRLMIATQGEAHALAPPQPTGRNMVRFDLGDERRSEWQAIKLPRQFVVTSLLSSGEDLRAEAPITPA